MNLGFIDALKANKAIVIIGRPEVTGARICAKGMALFKEQIRELSISNQ
jgi:hypothetical protein